ncbi:hypothetical protein BH11PAT1_BH11PAT1_0070 [soil metagenome]
MKLQDITFFIVLVLLFWKGSPRVLTVFGLSCLLIAASLFYIWVFFTAQRFTWYATAFFLSAIVLQMIRLRKNK